MSIFFYFTFIVHLDNLVPYRILPSPGTFKVISTFFDALPTARHQSPMSQQHQDEESQCPFTKLATDSTKSAPHRSQAAAERPAEVAPSAVQAVAPPSPSQAQHHHHTLLDPPIHAVQGMAHGIEGAAHKVAGAARHQVR